MSTSTIDAMITVLVMDHIQYDDGSAWHNFNDWFDETLQELFNSTDISFQKEDKPDLDDFMAIQQVCFEYLDECDSLTHNMIDKKDWVWWCNIYALSREWLNPSSLDDFKWDTFDYTYSYKLEPFQANVRRRQAQIKVIKSLHLTGNLPTVEQ